MAKKKKWKPKPKPKPYRCADCAGLPRHVRVLLHSPSRPLPYY